MERDKIEIKNNKHFLEFFDLDFYVLEKRKFLHEEIAERQIPSL